MRLSPDAPRLLYELGRVAKFLRLSKNIGVLKVIIICGVGLTIVDSTIVI